MSSHNLQEQLYVTLMEDAPGDGETISNIWTKEPGAKSRLDKILVEQGVCTEEYVLEKMCSVASIPLALSTSGFTMDPRVAKLVGTTFMENRRVAPVCGSGPALAFLTSSPFDLMTKRELQFLVQREISFIGTPNSELQTFLAETNTEGSRSEKSQSPDSSPKSQNAFDTNAVSSVTRMVDGLISRAVRAEASDVHIESNLHSFRVRFRIGGVLQVVGMEKAADPTQIIARIKVLCGLNVSETRRPQDGRMRLIVSGTTIDFRVSCIPTLHGESVVCRVLNPEKINNSLEGLGFGSKEAQWFASLIERPTGLVLVTGPTGSGKTTTLYTALNKLNSQEQKIITVEDPIEYDVPGIQQIQVNEHLGFGFPEALRSILRHDANVIMIGEIRDEATASLACRAALIGRLVLATLHTKSAATAPIRLIDLGVPEYLVQDTIIGVLGQKLLPQENGKQALEIECWEPS